MGVERYTADQIASGVVGPAPGWAPSPDPIAALEGRIARLERQSESDGAMVDRFSGLIVDEIGHRGDDKLIVIDLIKMIDRLTDYVAVLRLRLDLLSGPPIVLGGFDPGGFRH